MKTEKAVKKLDREKEKLHKAYQKLSEASFMVFCRGLTIDSGMGPRVFDTVMSDYQREMFEELAPCLEALRDGDMPTCRRFWIERTKKAGKDSDLAVVIIWLVCFSRRPFYGQVGAADRGQAGIVRKRIEHLLHWNPWLRTRMEMVQGNIRKIEGPVTEIDVLSSDVAGSHGGTPDILIINELSHIGKWEFAQNLMDNADGVPNGMVLIATNAGFKGTDAENWRNLAIESDDWSAHIYSRPAPWHSEATIKDAERRNKPRSRFLRLWWGIWSSGVGDALDEEDIDRAFNNNRTGPILHRQVGWIYLGGLDLGVSKDHAGVVVLGVHHLKQKLRLMYFKGWDPKKYGGEVPLPKVRKKCLELHKIFKFMSFWYDPHQAKLMAQDLERKGVPMREMTFSSAKNLVEMAVALIQAMKRGILECYDDEEHGTLRRDFGKLMIVEKSFGMRLEATKDAFGHADVGTALLTCLPTAMRLLGGQIPLLEDDDLTSDDDSDLTDQEMEDLPSDLKGIIESSMEDDDYDFVEFVEDTF